MDISGDFGDWPTEILPCFPVTFAAGIPDGRRIEKRSMARLSKELVSIFHTDEQIRQIRGVENSLRDLVEKCLQPLNAGLGVIIVPEKAIAIRCENSNEPIGRAIRLVKKLEADFDDWLKATDNGNLINDGSQTTPRKMETGVPCKVAAVRMNTNSEKADGIFVIARRPDAR